MTGEWDTLKYPWLKSISFSYSVDKCPDAASSFCSAIQAPAGSPQAYTSSEWNISSGVATLHWLKPSTDRAKAPVGTKLLVKHFGNMKAWGVYGFNVTARFQLDRVVLLSAAGMGLRCDFCTGTFALLPGTAVRPAPNRAMSTTADAVHLMHHSGHVYMNGVTIDGAGDDCFNSHGNFIVLTNMTASGLTAGYIDESGPGWFPGAATLLVGDQVAFYSRATLQRIGGTAIITSATPGYRSIFKFYIVLTYVLCFVVLCFVFF